MKRLIITVVFAALCLTTGLPQTRRTQKPKPTEPAFIDIQQVDFKNISYALAGKSYKLIDGFYAENTTPTTQWKLEIVDGLYYGDLTGDGKFEVAFVLNYGTVKAPNAAEARVYTLQKGRPALLATFPIAAPVNCQLDHYIDLDDGMIRVERIHGQGERCDYNEITQYRWNGREFMRVGDVRRTPCRCMF